METASPQTATTAVYPERARTRVDYRTRGVSARSVLIGAGLIIPNCFWIIKVEGIWHSNHATALSLFWNSITGLLLLVLLNLKLKRWKPSLAFSQAELITIYAMINIGSALAGHDTLQLGIPMFTIPFWYATGGNAHWQDLLWPNYPGYPFTIQDREFLRPYYVGDHTFYQWEIIKVWAGLTLWWCSFIVALGAVLISLTVLLRKQWVENERLAFPVVQLPMAMTADGGNEAFFKQKLLWVGFAIGAGIDIINGLAVLYPSFPSITVRHDAPGRNLQQYFTAPPWNAIGEFPLPLYPFLIAMGYFLPLDLGFSIWFFFLFKKALLVFGAWMGFDRSGSSGFPYLNQQSYGAWAVIIAMALYTARHHLRDVWLTAFSKHKPLDDSQEPMRYKTAILTIGFGTAYLFFFCWMGGMKPWVIAVYFGLYYLLSIGITRLRAELGPPAHEILGMNIPILLVMLFGTQALGGPTLAFFTLLWWISGRGYRTHPMPCQLEAFKMAHEGKASAKGMGLAMMIAMGVGGLATFWAATAQHYQAGSNWMTAHNIGLPGGLANWYTNPRETDWNSIFYIFVGAVAAYGMGFLRQQFTWWPFHPAGYALSMNYGSEYFWSCLMIATLIKWTVLRYGGYKLSRQLVPLMFGIILGEFLVGAFWSVTSVLLSGPSGAPFRTYDFSPG